MTDVLHRIKKEIMLDVSPDSFTVEHWIHNPDMAPVAGVPVEYWKIVGDVVSEMNNGEKAAVDAVLIPQEMGIKYEEFRVATCEFIYSRYAQERQQTLAVLRTEARLDNLQNRANYVGQVLVWMDAVLTYFYTKAAELQEQTTRDGIRNFTWDFSGLIAADPLVTIYQAKQIPD